MDIEKIKKWPICGKELPIEARFCPYCMTKLINEDGATPKISLNYRKNKILVGVLVILIFVLCVEIGFILSKKSYIYNNYVKKYNINTNGYNNGTFGSISESLKLNNANKSYTYDSYLGVWYGESVDDIHKEGGNKAEICKVSGNTIVFCVEHISEGFNKIASVEYMKVKLINGEGNFSFSDDKKGNSGTGIIRLNNNKIYIRINLNNKNNTTDWDLEMDENFKQVEKYGRNDKIDVQKIIGRYFEDVKGMFGEQTDVQNYDSKIEYEYEKGLTLTVIYNPQEEIYYVIGADIDYSIYNGDKKINWRGIDNTTKKKNVRKQFAILDDGDCFIKNQYTDTYEDGDTLDQITIYYDNGYVDEIECY